MYLENVYPYLACGSFPRRGKWFFFSPYGEIEIEGANDLFSFLLPFCNGENTANEILSSLGEEFKERDEDDEVIRTFFRLFELGVLVDKHSIFDSFSVYCQNPMRFCRNLSGEEIRQISSSVSKKDKIKESYKSGMPEFRMRTFLENRRSTREFSNNAFLMEDLFGLFWSAYGKQGSKDRIGYTVPSGGGIYPLVIYLVLLREVGEMKSGIYRWNKDMSSFDFLEKQPQIENIEEIIDGIPSFENVVGIMVVAVDFHRMAKKYSNKAYPLVLLEAGHVMQNAYLYCVERSIGFVEVLGFDQKRLTNLVVPEINDFKIVITGIFGSKGGE